MRDTGSKNKISNNLKEVFESGTLRGPRIVACGEGVAMTGGHGTHRGSGVKEADGPDEVRKAVREQLKAGADWIKLLASGGLAGMPERDDPRFVELGEDELRAGVEEAHKRRRRVCAHADATESIKNCIRAGVDCIEHGPMLDDEAINMMITHRTYLVPTMSGLYNFMVREQEHGSKELAALLDEVVIGPHRAGVAKACQAGVRIGTGTDTLGQLVQEIEMLHACGMSPMAAIQAATSVAAEILGLETEIGALEPGKRADAIVVRGNPLEHLGVLREVAWVIKNGSVVEGSWFWGDAG